MSISTEFTRIETARNTIRTKLVALGLSQSADKLDDLATAVSGIANRGSVTATVQEGDSYTIPAGYHNGSGTVTGVAGEGKYTLQTKTATPTPSQQSVTPDQGYYGLSAVTVAAIPSNYKDVSSTTASAGDVLATKIFVNSAGTLTTGTMVNNGSVSQTLTAASTSYTVPAGYHSGSGTVSIQTEEKSATPTTSAQNIAPSTGKVLSKVTVAAIPSNYGDVTNATAAAADLLEDKVAILNVDGVATEVEGAMVNQGTVAATLDGVVTSSYTIPAGYHSGSGTVSLDSTIENRLAAI